MSRTTAAARTVSSPTTVPRAAVGRTGRRRLAATAALLAAGLLAGTATAATAATAAPAWALGTARASVGLGGAQPDDSAWAESLSADGRYAVLGADATNLVPGDTNGATDVFVRDLLTRRTERVSLTSSGTQGDGRSYDGVISGNGRYVAFTSTAALVPGDTNGAEDIYLRDRWTGRTERLTTGDPKREVPGLDSFLASISWDGRYVAFASSRTDLVPGAVDPRANIYLLDRWSGTTRLISRAPDGTPANRASTAPVISGDGSKVGFTSRADNLLPPGEGGGEAARTADASDAPASTDEHVAGRPARTTSSPALGATGTAGTRAEITRPHYYPFYVYDVADGQLQGGSVDETGQLLGSSVGALSPDGRYALFAVRVPNTPDGSGGPDHLEIVVRDLRQGTIRRLPPALPGTVTTGSSYSAVMPAGNRWVYFVSEAENLVPGDTNLVDDIFRHDLWTGRTERLSVSTDGAQNTGYSSNPLVDALGTTVLFTSEDGTLVPGDTNTTADVFTRRLPLF
ncbi:TolB family protein [Kitasatospora sp. NPDC094019]|uniref:TolB family protein n=1 Tax=Kitasatospora sp. NPDC094019 TaxID=3364091 RepID=UPI0037F76F68